MIVKEDFEKWVNSGCPEKVEGLLMGWMYNVEERSQG